MKLENIVPWGRNLSEYKEMFMLNDVALQCRILGCGDGPSSFNAELTALGGNVTSIDPIYAFETEQIKNRIDEVADEVMEQIYLKSDTFVWKNIANPKALYAQRMSAMQLFLHDYKKGKKQKRYIHESLPSLSFQDNSFDIALSSHFLFLYSNHLDEQFHSEAIIEMLRVAKEVRIFPIITLEGKKSPHLHGIINTLEKEDYQANIMKTEYEFQKGGDEMLRIRRR